MRLIIAIAIAALALFLYGCSNGPQAITGGFAGVGEGRLPVVSTCSDSDGGITPDAAGAVTFREGQEQSQKKDACIGAFLVEWYCKDDAPVSKNMKCEGVCKSGQCI